jgi:CTP synthase (UTP-ammonia lyase)
MSEGKRPLRIGVLWEFDPDKVSHPETNEALGHAAARLSAEIDVEWVRTDGLTAKTAPDRLGAYDGFFAPPGFPANLDGGLEAIRYARESAKPFAGT